MPIRIRNTNPAHVFEIHPVTKINDIDVLASLSKIDGFEYKDAERAFTAYSNARCRIIPRTRTITIETNGVGYNYVDFWVMLNDNSKQIVNDGFFVYCTILNSGYRADGDENPDEYIISHKMRVGFVKGSALYDKVRNMNEGEVVHVVGIPRINLNLISWRASNATARPEVLQWNLPVEMIAVGELE
jgi:hypothetical protein